ncbi:MAG: FtsK/SpoIIIE domain-containing protein, partial [Chthoniobacterales bacterium]
MSKEIDLSISRSFGLEKQLKAAVAEFAKKQEQITLTLRNRKTTEVRKHRGEVSAVETWLAQGTQTAETNFAEKQAHVTQRGESRRKHIESARQGSASDLQKMARRAKERWMERLQMRHFLATQNQPIDLKTLEEKFTQFTAHLEEQRVALVHLQHRVRRGFFGFPSWWSLLRQEPVAPAESEGYLLLSEHLEKKLEMTSKYFSVFRAFWIPHLFSYLPIFITIPLLLGAGAAVGFLYPSDRALLIEYGIAALVAIVGLIVLQVRGSGKADASANILSTSLREATGLYNACAAATKKEYEIEYRRVQQEYKDTFEEIDTQWNQADEVERTFGEKKQIKVAAQIPRLFERQEKLVAAALKKNESLHAARIAEINREAESKLAQITAAHNEETTAYTAQETIYTNELETLWQQQVIPPYEAIQTMTAEAEKYAQPWSTEFLQRWTPPSDFPSTARFGSLNLDLEALAASLSVVSLPPLPGPQQVSIPLSLNFPESGSLLFETSDSGQSDVIQTLNNTILRVLSITPPGKLSFTIIDPIGLGQNFAGLMHLADFEESLINRRIWTQSDQIEARLEELNEHIEKVIQMYLRNEYATITEYNAQAGSVAEKYHFLVIADFPANFSETAIKRLQSIAVSGPRCGVFTLIHWDNRHPKPEGFVSAELEKNSICIRRQKNTWLLGKEAPAPETTLSFDRPPDPALQLSLVHKIGESSIDANRVEVPFTQIIPKPAEMWTLDSASEVRIPIGRTGATKLQYLSLGKGTRQHALFAGKTGSGKSTLFHVIITNLALAYSPDQVEFYLIDFKKGVEFKCYASHHLPHARVVAIESDREFGLSVLRRVDEELKRRGDIFRKLGVQDIPGYIREGGKEPMPRTLLIIDEFQEFFVQDDQIAQTASLLFDRIVRQGRAFGIHVLLGSQTLGGAYTLARATLGQMVVRVALQCNEADAYLIMDENNSAPRLLSRPGEGIYNDSAGAPEGNSPFQVVWLSDEERDAWLDKVHQLAEQKHDTHPGPIVFEG